MTRIPPEILLQGDREYVESWSQRNEFHSAVNRIGQNVIQPGDTLDESLFKDNGFYLLAGEHVGFEWSAPGNRIVAAPGAQITRLVTFDSEAHVQGVDFIATEGSNNTQYLCKINALGDVTFVNCRFYKEQFMEPTFIEIASGGKARFVGCWFGGQMDAAGDVINNAGPAGNVGVLASNKTTNVIGTATGIFITT